MSGGILKPMEAKMSNYTTEDMKLATILSMKFPVKELVNKNGRGTFVFEDTNELQVLVKAFWNKQLKVEPTDLFDALKMIKNRLYNDIKN
jgi:hypothetical protein